MRSVIALPLIAGSAIALARVPFIAHLGFSALPLAILLGAIFGHFNQAEPTQLDRRITVFCQQKLLRLGIILFGFSLSLQQVTQVGWQALVLDLLVTSSILLLGTWIGLKLLKLPFELAVLISAGSGICGAAAVLACEPVIKAKQQDVTVAVATVVLFGTLAMFSYPLIFQFSQMGEHAFGIYIGSTVHEVAQAVAAGDAVGGQALQAAVAVKLMRVMLLAPFIIILSTLMWRTGKTEGERKSQVTLPWFVFGFIAAVGVHSLVQLPAPLLHGLQLTSQLALAMAMAALGCQTQWRVIKQAGVKPMILASVLFVTLLGGGYALNSCLIAA